METYALLSELAGTLVLSVSQELNDAALIGGKANDLTGNLTDERSAAGRLALGTANLVLGGVEGSGFLWRNKSVHLQYSRSIHHVDPYHNLVFSLPVVLLRFDFESRVHVDECVLPFAIFPNALLNNLQSSNFPPPQFSTDISALFLSRGRVAHNDSPRVIHLFLLDVLATI